MSQESVGPVKRPLLIGSGNKDKAAELTELLAGMPWEVKTLADFPNVPEPAEDGETFDVNALKKAHYYAARFGVWCVADDSGLIVDALDGAPGVHSARYAGGKCTYADNNAKLLEALEGVPEAARTARFVCCAALVDPVGNSHVETGTVSGRIATSPRGGGGFGYDPVFIPEGYEETFGELGLEIKQTIGHRAQAFRKIRTYMETLQ